MTSPDIEVLFGYLDGSLPDESAARLESRLKTEPALAQLFIQLCRDETIMKEWSATVEAEPASMPAHPVEPRHRYRQLVRMAVAFSLMLAVGLVAWLAPRQRSEQGLKEIAENILPIDLLEGPIVGKLEDVQGDAFLIVGNASQSIRRGQEIRAGQQVRTGAGGVAIVQLPDSSRIEMGSDTQMTFGGNRNEKTDSPTQLFLTTGTVRAEVTNHATGNHVVLTTPHVSIKADNTRFSSFAAADTTSVEMESGQVEMTMSNGEQVNVPAGRVVVTGGRQKKASDRALPPRVTIPRKTLPVGTGPVLGVLGSPIENCVAINTWDSSVLMYDLDADKWLPSVTEHARRIYSMAFSRDGKRLATGTEDRFARVTKVADRMPLAPIRKHRTGVHAVALANDGKLLVTASGPVKGQTEVFVWNVENGNEIGTLPGHPDSLSAIVFHPGKDQLVTACRDSVVRVWDVTTLQLVGSYPSGHHELKAIAFSLDGKWFASAGNEGLVKLWNTEDWSIVATLEGHLGEVCSLAFSPDSKRLASCGMLTTIWLWDVETAMPVRNYIGHKFKITGVTFSADGKTLISSGWDRTVKLWNVEP